MKSQIDYKDKILKAKKIMINAKDSAIKLKKKKLIY